MRRTLVPLALAMVLPWPALAGQVTVRPGETLSEIAEQHAVSLSRLMQLNGISDPDHVEAGTRLTVPGSGTSGGGGGSAAGTVTVGEGETLSEIAERHGMSMSTLMQLNGISDPDNLQVGQTLKLSGSRRASGGGASTTPAGYNRGASVHVVQSGESLSQIAEGYGLPLTRLVAINNLSDPDHVEAGMRLKLKGSPAVSTPAPAAQAPRPQPQARRPEPQPARPQPQPTAVAPTPRATVSPAVARASSTPVSRPAAAAAPAAAASPSVATSRADWRTYGPLQVDWAKWQPMGGSLVAPTLNSKGQPIYVAINCSARKLNATTQDGQWRTWDDPSADFERQLVTDLCRSRS